ncbi:NADH-quinone oxidoreductase subunit L [Chitinibacter fontanus]|uniref:Probable inorganic carbon transporter subunit DabB n=1 Tax=Chitinibacter fontanus TaxID=1737446 RepID=A0A7D5ZH69_9NEIS|nr:NADH-quinone oxidoreductase subunit L [Chitinibacter fontanus]QLI82984.1 NADH-quinone oxidoreductase subunit L [Chitinibacter fontanus]
MQLGTLLSYSLPAVLALPMLAAAWSWQSTRWAFAQCAMGTATLLALLSWLVVLLSGDFASTAEWLNSGILNVTMLGLISFIAFIVLNYAKTNFVADKDNQRFLRWFLLTVSAVMFTVSSNHLLVFFAAWVAISLSMHQLLMFYPERNRSALAAHKKFIFARLAELCLAAAFFLLYQQHQTLVITEILSAYPAAELNAQQQLAAVLLGLAALIKCAQLPLHGWLIQIVESPTPVSALMHAGIINLGGFLLLSFAPLFSQAQFAQWLVLVVAGLTTVIAALVMTTRISIKVRLAWSTTAQMGLMLVECALGLYELALLHLLAHSCYKAYAFLNSGQAVDEFMQKQYTNPRLVSAANWLWAGAVSVGFLLVIGFTVGLPAPYSPWLLIGLALTFVLANHLNQRQSLSIAKTLAFSAALLASYYLLKTGMGLLLPKVEHHYVLGADLWIGVLFVALFMLQLLLQYRAQSPAMRKLFIALNAGFYLDEWATRITHAIWAVPLPKNAVQTRLSLTEVKS